VPGLGTSLAKGESMPRDFVCTTLRARHQRVVRALAEALFACEIASNGKRLDDFVREVDAFIRYASRPLRFGLLMMLGVIRFAPLFMSWRFATFEAIKCSDRVRILERMESSRFAPLTRALAAFKVIVCTVYFEDPAELAATGSSAERRRWARALPMVLPEAAE
jgi:hypothetical protein